MLLISKFGDRETFLNTYNPDYQRIICDNVDECLFGDYPTLAELRIGYGKNSPVIWLVPQLYTLSEYCGCKDKLEEKQLERCAFVISTEFDFLKISELMLFFHRFEAGRYGRFYGSVDPLVIATSLRVFINERNALIHRKEQEERQREDKESRKNAISWKEYLKRKLNNGKRRSGYECDVSVQSGVCSDMGR